MIQHTPKLLALATERVAAGDACIQTQHALIEALRRQGHDTTDAEALLVASKKVQAQFIAFRDWLRKELEEIATR